ncbi:5' nucleotidase, NT5C type [Sporocytophaga myxococcoides]|uniref:5' nucleotidase, NT5C type n=1 Tax=Sporocytophaga myxococcoides TaxID=153721 RepID=UPI0003F817DB|nr:5'-nucleotidase [Sporocytophaga myxococcoides]
MNIRKTIAIDMDNVIADVESHYIEWYEKENDFRVDRKSLSGVPETEALPDKTAVMRYLFTPGFFRTIPVMKGAKEALQTLSENYEIFIVSAAMQFPQSLSEKYEWLAEHFPAINWKNIVLCGDKSVINTDYMIDDHIKNLDYFKGKPLLFTASHNVHVRHHVRLNNWNEALSYFENELKTQVD